MLVVPTLHTARLVVRQPQASDRTAVRNFLMARDNWQHNGLMPPPDEAMDLWLNYLTGRPADMPNADVWWLLELTGQPGKPIGLCLIHGCCPVWRSALLGYELAPAFVGCGYMSEAVQAVLELAFGQMQIHRVGVQIHPDNMGSLNLAKRMGFVQEGRLRQIAEWDGKRHDLVQLSMLADDFNRGRKHDPAEALFPMVGMVGVDGPRAVELLDQ